MKPIAADEMFPEGIDIEDVSIQLKNQTKTRLFTSVKICYSILEWKFRNHVGPGC